MSLATDTIYRTILNVNAIMENASINSRRRLKNQYGNMKGSKRKKYRQKMSILFNEICIYERLIGQGVLFTNPSARAGYDTRSIFKRSLTGLNSEFSFS